MSETKKPTLDKKNEGENQEEKDNLIIGALRDFDKVVTRTKAARKNDETFASSARQQVVNLRSLVINSSPIETSFEELRAYVETFSERENAKFLQLEQQTLKIAKDLNPIRAEIETLLKRLSIETNGATAKHLAARAEDLFRDEIRKIETNRLEVGNTRNELQSASQENSTTATQIYRRLSNQDNRSDSLHAGFQLKSEKYANGFQGANRERQKADKELIDQNNASYVQFHNKVDNLLHLQDDKTITTEPAKKMLPVIEKLQELAAKEIDDQGKVTLARQIGPAYLALANATPGEGTAKELALAGKIKSLRNDAMRIAKNYLRQNIFKGQDLEFCFSKAVREDIFPNLSEQISNQLTKANNDERQRQINRSGDGSGFAMAIIPSPEKMLKELLWAVRDIE